MNNPSVWNPMASATVVTDLATLEGVNIPIGVDGLVVFVESTNDYYWFSLASGAAVDGFNVVTTSRGGASRWIKSGITSIGSINDILYGNGADGDATLDGVATFTYANLVGSTYTLTRDVFLNNLTVNPGVTLQSGGFKIFVGSTCTNNGTIAADGKNAALGVAGGSSALGTLGIGTAGGNGRANLTGLAGSNQIPANTLGDASPAGGAGGAGGANAGGAGGTYASSFANGGANFLTPYLTGFMFTQNTGGNFAQTNIIGGGAGGGGGGSDNAGVTGGGGGGGGGVLILHAFRLINNNTIRAKGGDGAAASGAGGNGGGGGGGGGGVILQLSRYRSGTGTISAPGGAGGAAVGTGAPGTTGSTGHINQGAA